jgi:hypothetical protein
MSVSIPCSILSCMLHMLNLNLCSSFFSFTSSCGSQNLQIAALVQRAFSSARIHLGVKLLIDYNIPSTLERSSQEADEDALLTTGVMQVA